MDAGIEAVVPLAGRRVAEVAFRLVPGGHGLALDYEAGLLVVGRAVVGVGHMQAHRGGLGVSDAAVSELASAALAEELPHLRVVELHDGEAIVPLHKLVGVAPRRHVDRHRRTLVAQVVAYPTPPYGHCVALRRVAHAEHEVLGEKSEAVVGEVLLHVEGAQIASKGGVCRGVHSCVVVWVTVATAASHHGQQQGGNHQFTK